MIFYRKRNNFFQTFLAFAAGAAMAIALAPKLKEKFGRKKDYFRLKNQILDKTSEISDLSREKYEAIVDEVLDGYSKIKNISQNELKDLASDLKLYWYRIRNAWRDNSKFSSGSQ